MKYPTISLVIVNYNSGDHLAETVQAVAAQTFDNFEATVVDNHSSDGSLLRAQAAVGEDDRFTFLYAKGNIGFAAGCNLGAQRARGEWLAFLNPDATPASDWLEQLLAATRRHPDVVMFGSTQIDATDPRRLDGAGDHYFATGMPWRGGRGWPVQDLPREGEVFAPCAAACFMRADAFRHVRGFDERFFCYVEDIDLAFRLRLMGHRCIQVCDAVVRHVGAASATKEFFGFRPSVRDTQSHLVLRQMHAGAALLALAAFAHLHGCRLRRQGDRERAELAGRERDRQGTQRVGTHLEIAPCGSARTASWVAADRSFTDLEPACLSAAISPDGRAGRQKWSSAIISLTSVACAR